MEPFIAKTGMIMSIKKNKMKKKAKNTILSEQFQNPIAK
jgi:hypothetical protein